MIRSEECLKKIKELQDTLKILGDSEAQEAYKRVIRRQIKGYEVEYRKALQRDEPQKGSGLEYGNRFVL